MRYFALMLLFVTETVLADALTIGSDGIDSKSTGLNGEEIVIGQIESGRAGKPGYATPPNPAEPSASNTKPEQVYFRTLIADPGEAVTGHATRVAGVMIGDGAGFDGLYEGVTPKARLYSAAVGSLSEEEFETGVDVFFGLTADRLARISVPEIGNSERTSKIRAINVSTVRGLQPPVETPNGNSHMTLFVDWSARRHDVLYVVAWGNNDSPDNRAPSDNFNGMTIAASKQVDPDNNDSKFRQFADINATTGHPTGSRTAISLLAPGQPVIMLSLGDEEDIRSATSHATPHVTGTVALLQQ